jgi:hypothetical protein
VPRQRGIFRGGLRTQSGGWVAGVPIIGDFLAWPNLAKRLICLLCGISLGSSGRSDGTRFSLAVCVIMTKTKPMLTLQIMRRSDGRYLTKKAERGDGPLGVDSNLNQAMATAVREATKISHDEQCRVAIDIELANGNFRRGQIISPPLHIRRKPRPLKLKT